MQLWITQIFYIVVIISIYDNFELSTVVAIFIHFCIYWSCSRYVSWCMASVAILVTYLCFASEYYSVVLKYCSYCLHNDCNQKEQK